MVVVVVMMMVMRQVLGPLAGVGGLGDLRLCGGGPEPKQEGEDGEGVFYGLD
jgi:hypothetical protein